MFSEKYALRILYKKVNAVNTFARSTDDSVFVAITQCKQKPRLFIPQGTADVFFWVHQGYILSEVSQNNKTVRVASDIPPKVCFYPHYVEHRCMKETQNVNRPIVLSR